MNIFYRGNSFCVFEYLVFFYIRKRPFFQNHFWATTTRTTTTTTHYHFLLLFRSVRISIRGLVRWLVGWSVAPLCFRQNRLLRILNDLDSSGRGKKRDEEERGTRRKEGRGGRSDEEEGATRRVKKNEKMKNLYKR